MKKCVYSVSWIKVQQKQSMHVLYRRPLMVGLQYCDLSTWTEISSIGHWSDFHERECYTYDDPSEPAPSPVTNKLLKFLLDRKIFLEDSWQYKCQYHVWWSLFTLYRSITVKVELLCTLIRIQLLLEKLKNNVNQLLWNTYKYNHIHIFKTWIKYMHKWYTELLKTSKQHNPLKNTNKDHI